MSYELLSPIPNGSVSTNIIPTTRSPATFQETLLRIVFVLTGIVGTFGNSLVCIVIGSALRKKVRTTNLLIFNQAAVDLCTSIMLIFLYTIEGSNVPQNGLWSEILCRFWYSHTLLWMLFVVSTYNLVMLCVERFIAVTFALYYSTRFKSRSAICMIVFSWIFAPFVHLYYPIYFDYNDHGVCKKHFKLRSAMVMGFVVILWEFMVPFAAMCALYTCIMVALRRQQRRVGGINRFSQNQHEVIPKNQMATLEVPNPITTGRSTLSPSDSNGDGASDQEASTNSSSAQPSTSTGVGVRKKHLSTSNRLRRNLTFTLLAVFVMFGLCWLPNHVTFFMFGLGKADLGTSWHKFTLFLAYTNMSINPFIYACKYRQFQMGFKSIFCRRRANENADIALHVSYSSATNRDPTRQRKFGQGLPVDLPNVDTIGKTIPEAPANDLLSNGGNATTISVQKSV